MINITNPERFLDFFTAIKSFRSPFRSFSQKEMTDLPTLSYTSGLEITAGQRTMSGLIGELTGQPFIWPVMLTSHSQFPFYSVVSVVSVVV